MGGRSLGFSGVLIAAAVLLPAAAVPARANLLYGIDDTGHFFSIDPTDGNTTAIGPTGLSITYSLGIDFSGDIYTIDSTTDHLDIINPTTGIPTAGAALSTNPGFVSGISFSPSGVMYLSNTVGHLFTVNPGTGVVTNVGDTSLGQLNDIAFDGSGNLYGWDGTDLVRINPSNGHIVSQVGDAGIFATAMSFDGSTLYTAGPNGLYTVSTADATATVIGAIGNINVKGINFAQQADAPAPEPGTWAMLLSGIAAVALSVRRKAIARG